MPDVPVSGGRYLRDPQTGGLVRVEDALTGSGRDDDRPAGVSPDVVDTAGADADPVPAPHDAGATGE